tara:strand:- start:384 stop:551 length:168 start_codon:yes stop_codon:yes gene_type:complete
MKNLKPTFRNDPKTGTIYIYSGINCYEVLDAITHKTIGGNVIHTTDVRKTAIEKL